jgi:hypothetical protein
MSECYSKEEIARMINWVDSQRQYWQSVKYQTPELKPIRIVQARIDILNNIVWKWQGKLEKGETISK